MPTGRVFREAGSSPYRVGEQPIALAAGDIDGDGITDLVVVNNADNTISFLLGTPTGAFRLLPPMPLGIVAPGVEAAPTAIVMAPLTGQTTPDLAVTHLITDADSPGFVTLWRRDAQGHLTRLGDPIVVGTRPIALVTGDLDGDGRLDLVVANEGENNDGTVTVLMNRGGGTFEPAGPALPTVGRPVALALANFDRHAAGRLDLAVLDFSNNNVLIFRNQGNGHFNLVPAASIEVGHHPSDLAVGDLDGDGWPDLAVVNQVDNSLTLLQNNKEGLAFRKLQSDLQKVGTRPCSVAVGPLDGDGQPVVAIATGDNIGQIRLVHRVPGAVEYTPANTSLEIGEPRLVKMVDLHRADAGGRLDLVVLTGSNTVDVRLNKGAGAFQAGASFDTPLEAPSGLFAIGDFTNDGRADLVVVSRGDPAQGVRGQALILLGNGMGNFLAADGPAALVGLMGEHLEREPPLGDPPIFPTGAGHLIDRAAAEHTYRNQGFVVAGDFNEDGNLDVAVLNKADHTVSILLGDGHGRLSSAHVVSPLALPASGGSPPINVWGLVCAPFTLSQHVDLAVLAEYPSGVGVVVFAGNGHGGFTQTAGSPVHLELPPLPPRPGWHLELDPDSKNRHLELDPDSKNPVEIRVPKEALGESEVESMIALWHKHEGDAVNKGDALVFLETAKVEFEVISEQSGVLQKIIKKEGDVVAVGDLLGLIEEGVGGGVPRPTRPPSHFGAVDCRGDGKLDLLVGVSDCLLLLQGNGSGDFPTQSVILDAKAELFRPEDTNVDLKNEVDIQLVGNATSLGPLAVGDINGDHQLDIVLTILGPSDVVQQSPHEPPVAIEDEQEHHFGWTFFVLKGDGTGRFKLQKSVPLPFVQSAIPHSVVLGDFDGEGRVDAVVATFADKGITPLRNDGTGQFTLDLDQPIARVERCLQTADINRDGLPELVCLVDDRKIGVYLSDAQG
jgi:hypothetical protein